MCKVCNGHRDKEMDAAYEAFSDFVWNHQEELAKARYLDWTLVFRKEWKLSSVNVARYYAKHVGCLFAQQSLRPPEPLVAFMDGATRSEGFVFSIVRDRGRLTAHRLTARQGIDMRGYWLPPSTVTLTPDGTQVLRSPISPISDLSACKSTSLQV